MSLSSRPETGRPRKLFVRFVALVCLGALGAPSATLIATRAAHAASSNVATTPDSAPPQAFHVGESGGVLGEIGLESGLPNGVAFGASLFGEEKLPVGFEMGHLPTFSERLTAKIGSALGFFAPPVKTKKAALPPNPSTGPVNFDFDADGKADYGRWHTATTEIKEFG